MFTSFVILGYFGPETVLPVTSIVATVIGVVMMMGRNSLRWAFEAVKRAALFRRRRESTSTKSPAPHAARSAKRESVEAR